MIAEMVGEERVVIDSIFVPDERRGLYTNEDKALKFAKGNIIHDKSPYSQVS